MRANDIGHLEGWPAHFRFAAGGCFCSFRDRFTWSGSLNNYGTYAGQFNPEPGETMPATEMGKWDNEKSKYKFEPKEPPANTPYAEMKPGQFNWPEMPPLIREKLTTVPLPTPPGR